MQGLDAVEEEVPRCQIQTHVSVCGCHIRLSAADKIQQQIAEFWGVGPGALSLRCMPLLPLILHAIGFRVVRIVVCAAISLFERRLQVCGESRIPTGC